MSNTVNLQATEYIQSHGRKKRWHKVVTALASVAVFCTTYALIMPAVAQKVDAYCGQEEHAHTDECYEQTLTLICDLPEEGHTHTDECHEMQSVLICNLQETDGHTHEERCHEQQRVLICSLAETDGHTHGEGCYKKQPVLACGLAETEGHTHGEGCYQPQSVLVCGNTDPEHVHGDECYQTQDVLVCGLTKCASHYHSDECYQMQDVLVCTLAECEPHHHGDECHELQDVLICGLPECEPHIHGDTCYEVTANKEKLICGKEEHKHTLQCYSAPGEDTENQAAWEASFESAELTGNWGDDIVAIAKTQLGYCESKKNYMVLEDGVSMNGVTRYGQWYGIPYGDWCPMFCSFCIHYAGVENFPLDSGCYTWIDTLSGLGLYHSAADGDYEPKPGDLIFFDFNWFDENTDRKSDHVGLVCELAKDESGIPVSLVTIEGNNGNVVKRFEYDPNDSRILGYGEIPQNMNLPGAVRTITTVATDGAEVDITGCLPLDVTVEVTPVMMSYDELAASFGESKASGMTSYVAYDIKIMQGDVEWQPEEALNVVIRNPNIQLTEDDSVNVAHIADETGEAAEVESALSEEGAVEFAADGFSVYVIYKFYVDFHNGEIIYSIPGKSSILLSTLMQELGIELDLEQVESVAFSDETLMKIEATEDGDWLLTSLEPFSTDEMLTITMADGSVLEIYTTDPTGTAITQSNYTNLSNSGTYYLNANFTASSTVTIGRNVNVTLDLNGHRLTSTANPLFNINGGTLTIIDTATSTKNVETVSGTMYGNAASYTSSSHTLTYYVTETQVTNSNTGATTETLKKYTVSNAGMIIGSGNVRAVTISSGTLNLNGGYICNFNSAGLSNNGNGGAIYASGGTINQNNAVLAANKGSDGGAIYLNNGATLNINGGVISGNDATRSNHSDSYRYGGGGVYIAGSSTVNMSGGYVTNNVCSADRGACNGGGGFMVDGSWLYISDGYITGNTGPGGGGIMTARRDSYTAGGKIYMTGGFITANASVKKEGGGVSIDGYGYMSLTGGYVTNNLAGYSNYDTFGDWGGGGIFVSDYQGLLYVEHVLVTDNHAGGFGGGIAGCSTGRLNIAINSVCANFDNIADGTRLSNGSSKPEDHLYAADSTVFMENGFQDYYCALSSVVSGGMLGGGTSRWTGSVDGEAVTSNSKDDVLTAASVMGLTANPSDADKRAASQAAKVFINGNESPTHGGGILVNGYLSIGPKEVESFCRLEFKATKTLKDTNGREQSLADKKFNFTIEDEFGKVVTTGTNSGTNIIFADRLAFTKAGTFTYYAYEEPSTVPGVVFDGARYKIEVTIRCDDEFLQVSDTERFTKHLYRFDNVKITKLDTSEVIYNKSPGNDEKHAVSLDPTGGRAFNNTQVDKINVKAVKKWEDGRNHRNTQVTVQLLRNGEVQNTQTLSSSNSWTYTWENLPTKNGSTAYTYSVREQAVSGYLPTYEVTTAKDGSAATQTTTITNTAVSKIPFTLSVKKVDEKDEKHVLPNAEFELRKDGNALNFTYSETTGRYTYTTDTTQPVKLVTAGTGYIYLDKIPGGTYTLVETAAPVGYGTASPMEVTLDETTVGQILSVTVEDPEMKYELPETGGIGVRTIYTLGAALTAGALMYGCMLRHKRERRSQ